MRHYAKAGRTAVLFAACSTILGCALLTGCSTSLQATRLADLKEPARGQVYYLPRAEFSVAISRELKSCEVGYGSDSEAAIAWMKAQAPVFNNIVMTEDAAKEFAVLLNDAILKRADVRSYVDAALGKEWRLRGVPTQANRTVFEALLSQLPEPNLQARIEVEMAAQVTPMMMPDESQAYSIRYDGMQEKMKGTDYAVETYPNGTLKSINVTLDDQTGAVIQGVVKGVAKLAAASSGFPLSLVSAEAGSTAMKVQPFADWKQQLPDLSPCSAPVRLRLVQRAALAGQIDSDAEDAIAAEKGIAKLEKALTAAVAKREEKKAAVDDLEDGDPKKALAQAELKLANADVKAANTTLKDARAQQESAAEAADKVGTRFAGLRKALTVTNVTAVRPMPKGSPTFVLHGLEGAKQAWLDVARVQTLCTYQGACDGTTPKGMDVKLAAQAALYPSFSGIYASVPSTTTTAVIYRQPVRSTLFVCKEQACLDGNNSLVADAAHVLLAAPVDVPQLGALAALPLENGPFQNNTVAASFAETGALTKLTYKTNAAAAKAAEVFEASADTVLKFKDAKRKQETTKLEGSTAEVSAQTKLVEAQLALEKAQADLAKFRDGQPKTGE